MLLSASANCPRTRCSEPPGIVDVRTGERWLKVAIDLVRGENPALGTIERARADIDQGKATQATQLTPRSPIDWYSANAFPYSRSEAP